MINWSIYIDGACSENPGKGGWGVHAVSGDEVSEWCGGEEDTTNNRMELTAAIKALQHISFEDEADLFSDSQYVVNGITKWIPGWKNNDWRTSDGNPVKNQGLWQELDALNTDRTVRWRWVPGHDGNAGNERADELAHEGMSETEVV